jgi:hypothetical protein
MAPRMNNLENFSLNNNINNDNVHENENNNNNNNDNDDSDEEDNLSDIYVDDEQSPTKYNLILFGL